MKVTALARIPVIAALLTPYCLGLSQGVGQVLEGKVIPTKLAVKDLPEKFYPVKISTNSNSITDFVMMMAIGTRGIMTDPNMIGLSWTDGSTTTIEGGKYLVTYQLDTSGTTGTTFPPEAIAPPSLKLVLVKTDSITTFAMEPSITRNDLMNLVPQDAPMPGEAAPTAPPPAPVGSYQAGPIPATAKTQALNNMKQLALGAMIYTADWDDVMPWPQSTAGIQEVTAPYLKNDSLWTSLNPNGGKILFNMALGGVSLVDVPDPANTVLYYDSNAWPGGQRLVGFTDGHCKFVTEPVWRDIKKTLTARYKKTAKKPLPRNLGLDRL